MCSTCTTAFDAIGTNAVVAVAVAANGWDRLRDRMRRRPRLERELENWQRNADFVTSMGLDPLATLGAPPAVPAAPAAEPVS